MGTRSDRARVPQPGSRARARTERPPRCEQPKLENGRPCKRAAGAGTDHAGEGPCSLHGGNGWQPVSFAENVAAQEAFLAAVTADCNGGTRALIEPLGYHRRDVQALLDRDPDFNSRYEQARGWDPDTIRTEVHRRAIDGSDRLLEFAAKMRLPEAEKLRQSHIDGRVDVTVQHVLDVGQLTEDELAELKRLLAKATPQEQLERTQRPALELVAGQ